MTVESKLVPVVTSSPASYHSPSRQEEVLEKKATSSSGVQDGVGLPVVATRAHMASTICLCICMVAHSYLLVSVFPYSGFMAIDLIPGVTEETAGTYAGLIASSFMVGRVLSSYAWGKAADVYGRKTVLLGSLGFSCVLTILFGLSPSYPLAMITRFLLGLSNGILGTVKTVVSELARGNETLESRAMGLVLGMWGYGFLISPALGGALAEPMKQYPNASILEPFAPLLSQFPFLLPNLVGGIFCIVASLGVFFVIEETLPLEKRRSPMFLCRDACSFLTTICHSIADWSTNNRGSSHPAETLPLRSSSEVEDETNGYDAVSPYEWHDGEVKEIKMRHNESCIMLSTQIATSPNRKSSDTIEQTHHDASMRMSASSRRKDDEGEATMSSIMARKRTRDHLLVLWMFSFVVSCIDEAFPLFCISQQGGLGLSEVDIGKILSLSGVLFVICQYFLFTTLVHHFGLYASIRIGSMVGAPLVALVPLSIFINNDSSVDDSDSHSGEMKRSTLIFLATLLGVIRIFISVFFSSISIAINRTVPPHHRGTMNGLSVVGGSVSKALGPSVAGFLVAFCLSSGLFSPQSGSLVVFCIFGSMGLAVATATIFRLKEEDEEKDTTKTSSPQIIHSIKAN